MCLPDDDRCRTVTWFAHMCLLILIATLVITIMAMQYHQDNILTNISRQPDRCLARNFCGPTGRCLSPRNYGPDGIPEDVERPRRPTGYPSDPFVVYDNPDPSRLIDMPRPKVPRMFRASTVVPTMFTVIPTMDTDVSTMTTVIPPRNTVVPTTERSNGT